MRFYIQNFGCRATQADGAALAEQLGAQGYNPVSESVQADLVLVNTCTVTASADRDARQYIRRLHRENPARRILVTGCYAQRAPEELAALPGVTWVVDNSRKPEIPALLAQELPLRHNRGAGAARHNFVSLDSFAGARQPAPFNSEGELTLAEQPAKIITGNIFEQSAVLVAPSFGAGVDRTRPTLKIQDGCNNRCAYCVIPFVRGKSRSLPPEEVIAHLQRLVGEGYQEVVLSGVDMGSYGFDLKPRTDLLELVELILRAWAAEKAAHFRARQVGARLRALTLTSSNPDGTRNALSENYLKLRLRGSDVRANRLVTARIETVEGNYLFGSV